MYNTAMKWDEKFLEYWPKLSSAVGIEEFDNNPERLIELVKQTLNSSTESTEFLIQDALDNTVLKLNNSSSEQTTILALDIWKKLADANDKKKSHSEVFTKYEGALLSIRRAFRRNPQPFLSMDSKFIEISFGTGNFIQAMVTFLMESLRNPIAVHSRRASAMTDDELRCYILDNMIYGVELQSHFPPLALYILDKDGRCPNLVKHLHQGDSLTFDFVFDGVPMMGKFDVVFGNPPYNVIDQRDRHRYRYSNEKWVSSREAGALHTYFIRLAQDLLKHGGMMLYVTRASVLVGEVLSDFREQILKKYFDIQLVFLPQPGTLFEGAQTTGMTLMAVKKDPDDTRTATEYTRFIGDMEYSCSYTIKETDEKIPLLWHPHTVKIWEAYSQLDRRFRTFKGISRDDVAKTGQYDIVDSITKSGPVFGKTDKATVKVTKGKGFGAERVDPKVLVSSGCTDAFGTTIRWLENYLNDTAGTYNYTGNVIAIVLDNRTGNEIVDMLQDPITQIYGSLFRIDRNTSAAHYRMFSYDMDAVNFDQDIVEWAKNTI